MLHSQTFDNCSSAKVCIYEHNAHNMQHSDAFANRPFITEIFKPRLFSSHSTLLRTRLTEFLLTPLPALSCLLYAYVNSLVGSVLAY